MSEGLNSLRFREPKQKNYYDANSDFQSDSSESIVSPVQVQQKRRGKKEEVVVPKVHIPRYTDALAAQNGGQLLEILVASELLFLNNFCEPLCKKAKSVLKTIFDKLLLVRGELMVGEPV